MCAEDMYSGLTFLFCVEVVVSFSLCHVLEIAQHDVFLLRCVPGSGGERRRVSLSRSLLSWGY